MKEKLWAQLNKNGYVKKKAEEGRRTDKEEAIKKEERKEKEMEKTWYRITNIGQHTERV